MNFKETYPPFLFKYLSVTLKEILSEKTDIIWEILNQAKVPVKIKYTETLVELIVSIAAYIMKNILIINVSGASYQTIDYKLSKRLLGIVKLSNRTEVT